MSSVEKKNFVSHVKFVVLFVVFKTKKKRGWYFSLYFFQFFFQFVFFAGAESNTPFIMSFELENLILFLCSHNLLTIPNLLSLNSIYQFIVCVILLLLDIHIRPHISTKPIHLHFRDEAFNLYRWVGNTVSSVVVTTGCCCYCMYEIFFPWFFFFISDTQKKAPPNVFFFSVWRFANSFSNFILYHCILSRTFFFAITSVCTFSYSQVAPPCSRDAVGGLWFAFVFFFLHILFCSSYSRSPFSVYASVLLFDT